MVLAAVVVAAYISAADRIQADPADMTAAAEAVLNSDSYLDPVSHSSMRS